MTTMKIGTLAYWDTLAGLVACKIAALPTAHPYTGSRVVTVEVTATGHNIYKRGEVHTLPLRHVVPRSSIYRRRNAADTILAYQWETA